MKRYREIVVLGAAESGTGAAVLAQKKGFKVFVSDKGAIKKKYKSVLTHFENPYTCSPGSFRVFEITYLNNYG